MDQKLKEKWVDSLRSGNYNQGRYSLKIECEDGEFEYCCLGVLCDILVQSGDMEWTEGGEFYDNDSSEKRYYNATFGGQTGSVALPLYIAKKQGLTEAPKGSCMKGETIESMLIGFNDRSDMSFADIASYIERNL